MHASHAYVGAGTYALCCCQSQKPIEEHPRLIFLFSRFLSIPAWKNFSPLAAFTPACIHYTWIIFAFMRKWHVHITIQDDRNLMSFHSLLFWMWTKISGDKCASLLKKISANLNLNFMQWGSGRTGRVSNILYLEEDKFPFTYVSPCMCCIHEYTYMWARILILSPYPACISIGVVVIYAKDENTFVVMKDLFDHVSRVTRHKK